MSIETQQKSYRGILRSSSLIGGSALINVLIGMVRSKFAAIYLGPSGIGLLGVYLSLVGIVQSVSDMGISTSGVREIAGATLDKDEDTFSKVAISLRRVVWATGMLGMLVLVIGSPGWSWVSFGNFNYAGVIALLGSVILIASITTGQSCILQGTRRIADLARISVIGAFLGTVIVVPCYYFFGEKGIVPSIILSATAMLIITWRFARRVPVTRITVSWKESRSVIFHLLQFGFPVMLAGAMTGLTGYFIRVLVVQKIGLEGAGIYQAAFGLSGLLVNFVLQAMGTDYYPRLTAVAADNKQMGFEVNIQTEIALLLAMPLLCATIIFAPVAIHIFYSGAFDEAVGILRWFVYGIFGRVISWPLGFVILAKGKGKIFFLSEMAINLLQLVLVWFCMARWGLPGAGVAYALLYVVNTGLVLILCYTLTKETWNTMVSLQIIAFCCILIILGLNCAFNPQFYVQWGVGLIILTALTVYCLQQLSTKSNIKFRTLINKFRLLQKDE